MRKFFIFFYVLISHSSFTQLLGLEALYLQDSNRLSLYANYDVHSTSIQNEINSKFFLGGTISDDDKINIMDKQKAFNRIGRELKSEVIFSNLSSTFFNLKSYSWMYAMSYQSIFSGNYSQDLLMLALNGNATTLGDTMNFGNTNMQQMTYQSFGVGIQDKKTRSYLSLHVVNLQSHFVGKLDGVFFTSADTSSIYLKTDGKLARTYRANLSNGLGLKLDLVLNINVPLFVNRNACFQLKISDFGFVKMSPLVQFKVDTTLNYDGFELNDLFRLQQLSIDQPTWMDTLNVKQDTLSQWAMLPVMLQFSKILVTDPLAKYQTFFGVRAYPSLSYFPKLFAGIDYKMNSYLFSGLQFSYGGFGGFRAGLYARMERKKMQLFVGSEDVFGLLSKKGFGQQVNLRLVCGF